MKAEQNKIASYNDEIFPQDQITGYQIKKIIGRGSYGYVAKAMKKNYPGPVAIKKISGLNNSLAETRRILRQIMLLKTCKHPNIVKLIDIFIPCNQTPQNFNTLYVVTQFCDSDLAKIFKFDGNHLEIDNVRYISYQIVCALKYLHSANIIHRDLKPANILINISDLQVKICDFGLARIVVDNKYYRNNQDEKQEKQYKHEQSDQQANSDTQNKNKQVVQEQKKVEKQKQVPPPPPQPAKRSRPGFKRSATTQVDVINQNDNREKQSQNQMRIIKQQKLSNPQIKLTLRVTTRWYRAPQIILLHHYYCKPVDIWSFGCIFGELLKMQKSVCADALQRFPLFPGKYCYPVSPNTISQVHKNGYPQHRNDQLFMILSAIGKPTEQELSYIVDEKAKDYVRAAEINVKRGFDQMFPKVNKEVLSILKNTLKFNPSDRLTIDQILNTKFFEGHRKKQLQVVRDPIQINLAIQNDQVTLNQLKMFIIKEIQDFKKVKQKLTSA